MIDLVWHHFKHMISTFTWLSPPPEWSADPAHSRVVLRTAAQTDFWQRTHYGFRADNGHFFHTGAPGDFLLTGTIRISPSAQYDQAGLMVRFSEDCWLKTSVEADSPSPRLGAVVTNSGFSDWSMEPFPPGADLAYALRIRRQGNDFEVEYAHPGSEQWRLIRVAHLAPGEAEIARAGFYACSPKGEGCGAQADLWLSHL
ncbi:MAG: DUF1349 domain-containing protein [Bryobacterales bacterium]|nr:DUF1349 domain-containing protein [Bryobacterales bacterium]